MANSSDTTGRFVPVQFQPALPKDKFILEHTPEGDDVVPLDVVFVGAGPAGLTHPMNRIQVDGALTTSRRITPRLSLAFTEVPSSSARDRVLRFVYLGRASLATAIFVAAIALGWECLSGSLPGQTTTSGSFG